eukprot:6245220-Prorocentrum_lima.AAC.1
MLEADEKAAQNRKPSWKVEEGALGNSAAMVKSGDVTINYNKEKNITSRDPMAPTCRFFTKTG